MAFEDDLHLLPSAWSTTTLGELCDAGGGDIQTGPFGSQLHAADYVSVGVPSIMPTNLSVEGIQSEGIARITPQDAERLQKYRVRDSDIVYSRRGDVEKCALVTAKQEGWLCGTGCLRVRLGKAPVNPSFVHAYLSNPPVRAWVVRHSVGATMPNLNTGILRSLPVAVPPPEEMESIGTIWATFIRKTNQLAAANKTLEAIARAIFKSWFVDFDPVRAKAEGREPEGMDATTAALFPAEFQDSSNGPIPKGWSIVKMEAIATLTIGGIWGFDSQEQSSLIKVVCLRGVDLEHLRSNGRAPAAPIRWIKPNAMNQRRLSDDEVLIGGSGAGPVGRPLHATHLFENLYQLPVVYSNFVKRLKCQDKEHAIYLDRILAGMHETGEIKDFVNGTSVPNLNEKSMLSTKIICLPSSSALHAFTKIMEPIMGKLYDPVTATLTELRDTLLPRLISGKLRVPDAEKMVEAVL